MPDRIRLDGKVAVVTGAAGVIGAATMRLLAAFVLAAAATAAGFAFANPTSRFIGHAVCDDPEWINGLSNPITESYHPKVAGHSSGYTPAVSPLLTGAALAVTADVVAASSATGDEQAALQRQYAAADRSIEPEVFVAPDLTTPEARRAARKAGVDLDRFIARSQRAAG